MYPPHSKDDWHRLAMHYLDFVGLGFWRVHVLCRLNMEHWVSRSEVAKRKVCQFIFSEPWTSETLWIENRREKCRVTTYLAQQIPPATNTNVWGDITMAAAQIANPAPRMMYTVHFGHNNWWLAETETARFQHGDNGIKTKGREPHNAPALVLSFCNGVCFATSNWSSSVSSSSVDSSSPRRGSSNPAAFLWAALLASVLVSDMVEVLSQSWKWWQFLYWVWNGCCYGADCFRILYQIIGRDSCPWRRFKASTLNWVLLVGKQTFFTSLAL